MANSSLSDGAKMAKEQTPANVSIVAVSSKPVSNVSTAVVSVPKTTITPTPSHNVSTANVVPPANLSASTVPANLSATQVTTKNAT